MNTIRKYSMAERFGYVPTRPVTRWMKTAQERVYDAERRIGNLETAVMSLRSTVKDVNGTVCELIDWLCEAYEVEQSP